MNWQDRIESARSPDERELLFREALDATANDIDLLLGFAAFLAFDRLEPERARPCYEAAIALRPADAILLGNYADFLASLLRDDDRAETYYRKALAADPYHASNLGNYANFLLERRKDPVRAEECFRMARGADPYHVHHLGHYGFSLVDRGEQALEVLHRLRMAIVADAGRGYSLSHRDVMGVSTTQYEYSEGGCTSWVPRVDLEKLSFFTVAFEGPFDPDQGTLMKAISSHGAAHALATGNALATYASEAIELNTRLSRIHWELASHAGPRRLQIALLSHTIPAEEASQPEVRQEVQRLASRLRTVVLLDADRRRRRD
jgi:tetratricopeptide (TPR) repeat protein